MAISDPILFTGKELNLEIPKFTELNAAADRLRNKLQREEDLQKELQKELRDNLNVDMETFTSTFATKQQAEMYKNFINKYTLRAKQNGGKLTNDDLIEQRGDAVAIATRQKEWLTSQKLWEQDAALIKQKPLDYDRDKFNADTAEYMRTGIYKPNSLEYSGINLESALLAEDFQGASPTRAIKSYKDKGGIRTYEYDVTRASVAEAKKHVASIILGDLSGRILKGVVADFMKAPDKEKYLIAAGYDKTKDGSIDANEMRDANVVMQQNILTNPVIQWAIDRDEKTGEGSTAKYLDAVIKKGTEFEDRATPTGPSDKDAIKPFTDAWAEEILWRPEYISVPFVNNIMNNKEDTEVVTGIKNIGGKNVSVVHPVGKPEQYIPTPSPREAKYLADYLNAKKVKPAQQTEVSPFNPSEKYDIPQPENGKYEYAFGFSSPFTYKGGWRGKKEKAEKIEVYAESNGTKMNLPEDAVFMGIDADKKNFIFASGSGDVRYRMTKETFDSIQSPIKNTIYKLKIQTPSAIKTIEEFMNEKTTEPSPNTVSARDRMQRLADQNNKK